MGKKFVLDAFFFVSLFLSDVKSRRTIVLNQVDGRRDKSDLRGHHLGHRKKKIQSANTADFYSSQCAQTMRVMCKDFDAGSMRPSSKSCKAFNGSC